MGIKRTLIRVSSFAFQGVIAFVLFALAAVQAHPADVLTGIAAFVQDVSAASTKAALTFAPKPEVKPVPVTVNL